MSEPNSLHYNQMYLNSYSEIPFFRKKNTLLCTDVIKHNKLKIIQYKEKPKKVVYHDSTLNETITEINYEQLLNLLSHEDIIQAEDKDKGIRYSNNDSNIIFDSNFEQGNLKMAIEIDYQKEYDIVMRRDFGGNKIFPWFFFSLTIKNLKTFKEAHKKDYDFPTNNNPFYNNLKLEGELAQHFMNNSPYYNNPHNPTIKINIINFFKDTSFFSSMVPVLTYNDHENKWSRNTFNVFYYSNGIIWSKLKNMNNSFQTLAFTIGLPKNLNPSKNSIKFYFAYCYPYTFTQLRLYINSLDNDINTDYIKFGTIGKTELGNDIPLLVITNFKENKGDDNTAVDLAHRKCVLLTARIHPGETSSSYVIQGVISFLLSNNKYSNFLRNRYLFKIVPMLNPDGVILGNYRFNAKGKDLNRMWMDYSTSDSLSIVHMRNMIEKTLKNREIFLFCDFHGHSGKSNFFVYGCQKENCPNYQNVFFKILNQINPNCNLVDCIPKINPKKIKTGRAILKNDFNIDLSYCLESSMTSFVSKNKKTGSKMVLPFTIEKYKQIGIDFCKALYNMSDENNFNKVLNEINSSYIFEENKEDPKSFDN